MFAILKIIGGVLSILALGGGLFISNRQTVLESVIEKYLPKAEELASEQLGVPVKIGNVVVDFDKLNIWHSDKESDITVHGIEIFDKNSELIAKVDTADVNFKFIALFDDPVAAVDEIKIDGAQLNIKKRENDSWNFDDIKLESEGESTFDAKVFLTGGTINAAFDDKNISVEEFSTEADCADKFISARGKVNATFDGKNISVEEIFADADYSDMNAVAANVTAKTLGAQVKANGTLNKEQQVINLDVDNIFFDKILPYLPEDKIPEGVEILNGAAENTTLHLLRKGDYLSYTGNTKIKNAAVKVEETDVKNINGNVTFNERELIIDGSATANGQFASASGTIRLDTDEIFFDVFGESNGFTPAAIIADIGIEGAADIRAHLIGTAKNPQVDADIYSDWLAYEEYSAQNISTKLHYVGEMLYLNDISANVFGGNVTGTVEVKVADKSFNANVKANGLDVATICQFVSSDNVIDGKISADVGINGGGDRQMQVYGNAKAIGLNVEGFYINDVKTSFYLNEDNVTIDYLSANLPNQGTLGLEGKITDMSNLALNFYGAHVDMALLKNFNDKLDMSGLADFKGAVIGEADNPNITLELSAVDMSKQNAHFVGNLFKQPFDSIQLVASGSLDGINIDKFNLEKDGNIKWTVTEGKVGLTGEKNVDITLDTTQVRVENLAALIMPELGLTGNLSNSVKITGTIDNPQVAGNVKLTRGSLTKSDFTLLISEVNGDYFLEDNKIRLQDFKINSPLIDAVLNGEIKTPAPIGDMIKDGTISTEVMTADLVVQGTDINLQRFKAKLPEQYNAEGHISFEGVMKGTLAHPIFDGELKAEEIFLNSVALTNVYGHIEANGTDIYLDDFHFQDGAANCQVQLSASLDSGMMNGEAEFTDGNIENLFKIFNVNNKYLAGKLNSTILIGGTFDKPTGSLTGEIYKGTFAGYDIHDVKVAVNLLNNSIYFNQLEGKQGDNGTINLLGAVNLGGTIDLKLMAKDLELGIFPNLAGVDVETIGTTSLAAEFKGTTLNPFGSATLTAKGKIAGATFDSLNGVFRFKDSMIDVVSFIVTREISDKTYSASVEGLIPLKALFAKSKENLSDKDQLKLKISLDEANLSLLPGVSNYVAFGVGDLNGAVEVTGTAAHPQLNGQISLIDGSVKIKHMKNLIEHINISTLFKGERFDVENFFGGLDFRNYNFDLAANNLEIDCDFYDGPFNANFNLSEGHYFRETLPKISGQINLEKCTIGIPPLPDDDEPPPDIMLDVKLNLGQKVHFYSSHLFDMYFTGNANFEGTTRRPKTSGVIEMKKRGGTLTYLETVFNIRECEVHFNQAESFLPTLSFAADTKISNTKIFLNAKGQPNNMEFNLTSSPEMTQEEIAKLLTLRDSYSRGGDVNLTAEDALAIGLQMTLLGELEDALRKTVGIDQFTVSRGSGSMFESHTPAESNSGDRDKDYNVKIGKYVNDKLMIRYTRGFGSHKVNRYGLQYDFNDNLGFTIEREGKDYIFSFEARYKF